jgi:hypothetical protein
MSEMSSERRLIGSYSLIEHLSVKETTRSATADSGIAVPVADSGNASGDRSSVGTARRRDTDMYGNGGVGLVQISAWSSTALSYATLPEERSALRRSARTGLPGVEGIRAGVESGWTAGETKVSDSDKKRLDIGCISGETKVSNSDKSRLGIALELQDIKNAKFNIINIQ